MTNNFQWNVASGVFSDASSWSDLTSGAAGPPGETDTASFDGNFGIVTGAGTVSLLNFAGTGTIAGSLTAESTLTVSSGFLTLAGGGALVAANLIRVVNASGGAAGLVIGPGASVTDTRDPNQASVNSFALSVGGPQGSGAGSSMTVSGSGALLNLGLNAFNIGEAAGTSGSFTIASGGTVIAGAVDGNIGPALRVGRFGNGTLTVTDAGSMLAVTGQVNIGRGSTGSGTLVVENSATMMVFAEPNDGGLAIGSGQPANSLSEVAGTGVVTVTNGGVIRTATDIAGPGVSIGSRGDTGTLQVGAGGTVEVGTSLTMGGGSLYLGLNYAGNGTLSVAAGGVVKSDGQHINGVAAMNIGVARGGTATAAVSGAGALLDGGGDRIVVGDAGSGTLTVSQGGSVAAGASFYSDAESALVVGNTLGAIGMVTLTDSGSMLSAAGEIDIGVAGYGALTIANGATLTAGSAVIGLAQGGYGTVGLSGAGSLLTLTGTLQVGSATADGAGVLTLGAGATVVAAAVQIGDLAVIHMQGGTLDPFSIVNAGVVAGYGVLDGPLVNNGSLIASGGALSVAGLVSGAGTLAIASNAVLSLAAGGSAGVAFQGAGGVLALGATANLTGAISGFAVGDTIDLLGAAGATANFSGGGLTIGAATTSAQTLSVSGAYANMFFNAYADGNGGTDILLSSTQGGQSAVLPTLPGGGASATNARIQSAIGALAPPGTIQTVVTVAGGGFIPPSVPGTLNALVYTSAANGSTLTTPAGFAVAYLLAAAATLQDTIGGAALIDAAAGSALIGAANDTLFGGDAGATLFATTGAETLVGGTGTNAFFLGSSIAQVTSEGTDIITGSSGAETVNASGSVLYFGTSGATNFIASGSGGDTLIGGGNGNTITGGGGSQLIFGSSTLNYTGGAGAATIIGGGAGNTVAGGAGNLLLFASGRMTYTGTGGTATVIGGGGPLNAALGAGGGIVYGSPGGGDVLSTTSSAQSILVGGGDGDVLTASGSGADILVAGGGVETIDGSAATGNLIIFGGSGSDVLTGGTGDDDFLAEPGNETLTGGSGTNLYLFIDFGATTRTDVITDFNPAKDAIGLFAYGDGPEPDTRALASAAVSGGNTVVTLTDGTAIVLNGAPKLQAFNFF